MFGVFRVVRKGKGWRMDVSRAARMFLLFEIFGEMVNRSSFTFVNRICGNGVGG